MQQPGHARPAHGVGSGLNTSNPWAWWWKHQQPPGVGVIPPNGTNSDDTDYAEGRVVAVSEADSTGCQVATVTVDGEDGGPTISAVVPPHMTMDPGAREHGHGEWIRIKRRRLRKSRRRGSSNSSSKGRWEVDAVDQRNGKNQRGLPGGAATLLYFARGRGFGVGITCSNGAVTQIHDARGGGAGTDLEVAITNVDNIFDGDQIVIPEDGMYEIELAGLFNETLTSAGERVAYFDGSNSPGPVISGDVYLAVTAFSWVATANQIPGMSVRYLGPLPAGMPIFPKVMHQDSSGTLDWFTRYLIVRKF